MKRYYENNMVYFITIVTEERRPIFLRHVTCDLFINVITYQKIAYDYKVYGFVIMPEHIHLIIQPVGAKNISEIMKNIKGSFSRFYNKVNNNKGSIWQRRFYDKGIRSEQALLETINYIHNNPLRKELIGNISEYKYSSYNLYMNEDRTFSLLLDRFQ